MQDVAPALRPALKQIFLLEIIMYIPLMVFTRLRKGKGIIAVSLSVLTVSHALVGVFEDLGVGENRSLKSVKGRFSNASQF